MNPSSRRLLILLLVAIAGCQRTPQTAEEKTIALYENKNARVIRNEDDHATQIYFTDSQVQDADLTNMKDLLYLVHVEFVGSPITDVSIEHLTKVTSLRSMDLSFSQITDEGMLKLRKSLPDCRITHARPEQYTYEKLKRSNTN